MKIQLAPLLSAVKVLLLENGLPVADLDKLNDQDFLYFGHPEKPLGAIGLQLAGNHALLRSLVVAKEGRGQGNGKALVNAVESLAHERGVHSLFLLTETAESFFKSLGYRQVSRADAPQDIKETDEFSQLCPNGAILMTKVLSTQR